MKQVELLAPAGSLEIFYAVIHAGADAVYMGGQLFGARAYASNLSEEEIITAIQYAHLFNRKVYLTVNTLVKDNEYKELYHYMVPYVKANVDGVIVQDLGVISFLHQYFPELVLHSSTQMSISSSEGANYMKSLGVSRIVPSRELSLKELASIHEETGLELETFIHGALCYCYSGNCLFSSILGGRSGNRGRCTQPCRLPYTVYRNREIIGQQGYWLSMKDLNTIKLIPDIIKAGVCSLKIEGRMKQKEYAAGVVSIYRKYLNLALAGETYVVDPYDEKQLLAYGHRGYFTEGYYKQHNAKQMISVQTSNYQKDDQFSFDTDVDVTPHQIDIRGYGTFEVGHLATLTVEANDHMVTVEGDIVEAAKNKPMDADTIGKKCKKTGGTNFNFKSLELTVVGDVFLPVSAINRLRRDALTKLQQELLGNEEQLILPMMDTGNSQVPSTDNICQELSISIDQPWQANLAIQSASVTRLYLNTVSMTYRELNELLDTIPRQSPKVKLYLILPWMMREEHYASYIQEIKKLNWSALTGLVVGSIDSYGLAQSIIAQRNEEILMTTSDCILTDTIPQTTNYNHALEIISDPSLYSISKNAANMLSKHCATISLPYELNRKELRSVVTAKSEMTIYGYIPLMITAGCLHRNVLECNHVEELLHLEDRYQKYFPVRNFCKVCYNIVYNSSPLCLLQSKYELDDLNLHQYRIHFTIESREEVESVMNLIKQTFDQQVRLTPAQIPFEYTKGHYKRGVE